MQLARVVRAGSRLALVFAFSTACTPTPDGANLNPQCQPIAGASCLLPYPSSFYLTADTSTATGYRVAYPAGALPKNQVGSDFDTTRLNFLDGFSPATQILADLGARVDPTQLVGIHDDYGASQKPTSAVQLLAFPSGERVPLFAEVDANVADQPGATQLLIIHPLIRLQPATRYVVALVGLHDTAGKPIAIPPFRALTDGKATSARLVTVQGRYQEMFVLLEKQGVPRGSLTLAWDFVTASDVQGYGHVLTMRDTAFQRWESQNLGYTVSAVDAPASDPHVLRTIKGTFQVPSFLTSNSLASAGLQLDGHNHPVDSGTNYDARLLILVPRCAASATQPLRVVVYGHGLLGGAGEIQSGLHRRISDQLCIIEAATDWIGLSSADLDTILARVFGDFSQFWLVTDRLQQAQVNFLTLIRLAVRKMKDMPELTLEGKPGGKPLVDGKQVYYLGGSQGGIEGNTLLALSPDIDRGVLNVGGGIYSMMMPRSVDFWAFKLILDQTYPSPVDQQVLLAVSQSYWDYADPIAFVSHTLRDPFPGPDGKPMPPKHVLLQESHYDAQVPNVATRVVARTMDLPQLGPPVEAVYGLMLRTGPLDSAYTQYDIDPTPHPSDTNVSGDKDNGAHGSLGNITACVNQMDQFLRPGGTVVQTCMGTCVFPATPR